MESQRKRLFSLSNNENNREPLAKRGRLFGEYVENTAPSVSNEKPSVRLTPTDLRSVNKAYALRATLLPYSNTENVKINFPENYESFAMLFQDATMTEMNSVYPLYDSLESFKDAPAPAIYVYGIFDTGFGALEVKSYSEFLTRHTAVARRKGATKVYAAGEIFKRAPTVVEYNVSSGTYSKELVDRGVATTEGLMEYVGAQLSAAGFTAMPATGPAATPGTFITANALPVTNAELNIFRRFGLTATKVAKTRRRRTAGKTRKLRR